MTDDQLFEKKQECAGLRNKMEDQLLNFSFNYKNFLNVDEIFYSPVKNSCLYTIKIKPEYNFFSGEESITEEWIDAVSMLKKNMAGIIDYFGNKIIINTNDIYDEKTVCYSNYLTWDSVFQGKSTQDTIKIFDLYFSCMKAEYDKQLKELKWE